MREFEKALKKKIKTEVPRLSKITPGIVIEVYRKGEIKGHLRIGETYQYYDLASLTKIVFTATAWMRWVDKSDFDVHLPAYYFLPWWRHREVTVRGLLTHSAGLSWWKPYYRSLKGPVESRWARLATMLRNGRPQRRSKAVYSDLDLYLLGYLIEELEQKSLLDIWNGIRDEMGLPEVQFHVGNRPPHAMRLYAPTERCGWRDVVMQGQVHDENTFALGGVAPHAGLFSDAHGIGKWALQLRRAVRGEDTSFGRPEVVQEFVRRQLPRRAGDWGYLFMKPSDQASCGKYFSKQSFGHTGFTGTSLWMDPVKDLIVIILSNRVHPTRENKSFLQLRPKLHDWICELL